MEKKHNKRMNPSLATKVSRQSEWRLLNSQETIDDGEAMEK